MEAAITQLRELGVDVVGPFRLRQQVDILRRADHFVRCERQTADQRESHTVRVQCRGDFGDLLAEAGERHGWNSTRIAPRFPFPRMLCEVHQGEPSKRASIAPGPVSAALARLQRHAPGLPTRSLTMIAGLRRIARSLWLHFVASPQRMPGIDHRPKDRTAVNVIYRVPPRRDWLQHRRCLAGASLREHPVAGRFSCKGRAVCPGPPARARPLRRPRRPGSAAISVRSSPLPPQIDD